MFEQDTVRTIRETVFDLVHFAWQGDVDVREGEGLSVHVRDKRALITAQDPCALARAFFRMAQELSSGKTALDIRETRHFASCGPFLDFSRNGVMTVPACKHYMNFCAALGLNLLVIYTEDTFTVPEYPYMGYLRGRLTQEEFRELDEYAASLGIELVPCIQTLAHLGNFLQWQASWSLKDQPTVLLPDEEATYNFIEAEIRAIRQCIRGSRLHIGMDEAHGVGLGNYFLKHGPTDRFQLLSRHLNRVVDICKKYGFQPMMWSDMFFRLGSKTNEYYDLEANIPQSVLDSLPPVDMVYWDYYHQEEIWYERMLAEHARMGPNTIFAGGIWTWSGFLPQVELTWQTMEPALKVCAKHHVQTVMATMWGDDGQETMHSLALNQLPIFSESCWRPESASRDVIEETGEFLTGLDRRAYNAMGRFYREASDSPGGKSMIWCDLLYPLGPQGDTLQDFVASSEEALRILSPIESDLRCAYAAQLFEVIRQKGLIMQEVRARYQAGDKAWFAYLTDEALPALMEEYRTLRDLHRTLWESEFKRNGWEVLALRYGAAIGRLEDISHAVSRYVRGELSTLCELEEEPLAPHRSFAGWYKALSSPVYNP